MKREGRVGRPVDAETEGVEQAGPDQPEYVSHAVPQEPPRRPENDKIPFIGLGFALVGYLPPAWFARLVGFSHFGPLEVPAILAMVGVLFAVIGILRAVDWKDQRTLRWSLVAGILAMGRLFILPFL